jgi:hypothetical protein
MRELDKALDNGEKILWEGKPEFLPFFMDKSIIYLFIGLILVLALLPPIIINLFSSKSELGSLLPLFFGLFPPFFLLGITFILLPIIFNSMLFKNTHYAITNKRLLVQTGIIGRDFQSFEFDKRANAEVNINAYDKVLGKNTGTIRYLTPEGINQDLMLHITNPQEALSFFKNKAKVRKK